LSEFGRIGYILDIFHNIRIIYTRPDEYPKKTKNKKTKKNKKKKNK